MTRRKILSQNLLLILIVTLLITLIANKAEKISKVKKDSKNSNSPPDGSTCIAQTLKNDTQFLLNGDF
jgi:hypothetical protein